jgi:threonine/homoserine/homoserine lactone efflux protein
LSLPEIIGLVFYGMFIGVALAAPIGPVNIEIISRGIRFGFLSGWSVGLGALSVDTVYALLVVTGLTPLADSPTLRFPLFLAGGVMLAFVGSNSLKMALSSELEVVVAPPHPGRSFVTGVLIAALSPMGIVYWLSVGAALVAEAVDRVGSIGAPVLVGGVFIGLLTWVTTVAVLARTARRFVTGRGMKWITGVSGTVILGFAAWFLIRAFDSLDRF